MTKGFHKKQSKRITCKKRYKIEKKVREHNKKLRKAARKSGATKRKPKDPGMPNNLPFADKVVQEAQQAIAAEKERKQLVREEKARQRQRDARDKKLAEKRGLTDAGTSKAVPKTAGALTLADLARDAERREKQFQEQSGGQGKSGGGQVAGLSNLSAHYKEFQKVVEEADVLIEVLDARDPLGTRCREVEEAVLSAGTDKKLVLLLNKVDLIPRENLDQWLRYLRQELPTLAFKASTQEQQSNIGRSKMSIESATEDILQSSKCFGAKQLMHLLGSYSLDNGVKTAIKIGVVGFPNVGKSSVINSLKRSRACGVGATPGLTKARQEVSLDKHIKLLDSPGIVFATSNQFGDFADREEGSRFVRSVIALRNATRIESLPDPTEPIEALISRVSKEQLLLLYKIADYSSPEQFLELIARRFGKLKKGGVADLNAAARKILGDWNTGKIRYHSIPPVEHKLPDYINSEIVEKLKAPFRLEDFDPTDEMEVDADNGNDYEFSS